ncbi:oligosaccharide flippase family protein [Halomonas sp. MA07-2]|uniref:oligosaccharide flippase family protein n=1 Tax=Halomonas sp. MA07-2 TaxID=3440841 RepID=UPI003EEBCBA5
MLRLLLKFRNEIEEVLRIIKMKYISKHNFTNVVSLYALQGINILYPLLIIPFLVSGLGVEGAGVFMLHQSLIMVAFSFVSFGFDFTASRSIAKSVSCKEAVDKVFSSTLFAKGLLAAVMLLLAIIVSVSNSVDFWLLLSFFPMIIGGVLFPIWYFQAIEKMRLVAIFHATSKLLGLVALFVFISSGEHLHLAAFLVGMTYLFSAFLSWFAILKEKKVRLVKVGLKDALMAIKVGRGIAINSISNGLYANLGLALLGGFSQVPDKVLAQAGLGAKLRNSMPSLNQPLNQVIYIKSTKNYSKNGKLPSWIFVAIALQVVVISFATLLFLYYSDFISGWFLGVLDESRIVALFILAGGVGVVKMTVLYQIAAASGGDSLLAKIGVAQVLVFACVFFSLTLFIPPSFAVALSYLFTDIMSLIVLFFRILRGRS